MINILNASDCFVISLSVREIGDKKIQGVTTDADGEIVVNAIVKLFNQDTSVISNAIMSDKNGAYEFSGINTDDFRFFVVAHHPTGEYNGVIADNIHGVQDVES